MCQILGAPCVYEDQLLDDLRRGMNITEAEFNSTVDSLVKAMNKTGWSIDLRNRFSSKFGVFREEVLYI